MFKTASHLVVSDLELKVQDLLIPPLPKEWLCSTSHDCSERRKRRIAAVEIWQWDRFPPLCPVLCQQRCLFSELCDQKGPGGKALKSVSMMWEQARKILPTPAWGCKTVRVETLDSDVAAQLTLSVSNNTSLCNYLMWWLGETERERNGQLCR